MNEVLVDTNTWRRILEEKLRYSYKRWISRPLALDFRLLELMKMAFTVKLLNLVQKFTLLINIDYSSIFITTIELFIN